MAQAYIYESAPSLLLDKIAELNSILAKHKFKNPGSDQLSFYEDLIRIMKFSYAFMRETNYIHERNALMEAELRTLRQLNSELMTEKTQHDVILKLQTEGRLAQAIKNAEEYTDNVMSLYTEIAKNKH